MKIVFENPCYSFSMVHFESKIDAVVLSELKSLVIREREVTSEILRYLCEVEARNIHLERGFPSLFEFVVFEFVVKELGYSAGAAHRNFEGSYAVLFHKLADMALKKLTPAQNEASQQDKKRELPEMMAKPDQDQNLNQAHAPDHARGQVQAQPKQSRASNPSKAKPSRYLPKDIKAAVYRRDEGKCTYHDRITNRRCESEHAIEYDHLTPFCMGGETSVENLRLLCPGHHRLETEKLAMIV